MDLNNHFGLARMQISEVIKKYQEMAYFDGIEIKSIDQKSIDEETMLHKASYYGNADEVRVLVENGASIDLPGDMGYTPLLLAVSKQRFDVAKILLEHGADVVKRTEFDSNAMDLALMSRDFRMIELIKKYLNR